MTNENEEFAEQLDLALQPTFERVCEGTSKTIGELAACYVAEIYNGTLGKHLLEAEASRVCREVFIILAERYDAWSEQEDISALSLEAADRAVKEAADQFRTIAKELERKVGELEEGHQALRDCFKTGDR